MVVAISVWLAQTPADTSLVGKKGGWRTVSGVTGKVEGFYFGGLLMAVPVRRESPEGFVVDLRFDLLPRERGRRSSE